MGVDAQMLAKVRRPVTPEEVKRLAVAMQIAIGKDVLSVYHPDPDGFAFMKHGRHCLEIVKKFEQDGPAIKPKKGETLVEVHLAGRYYGPGYERGDLVGILAVARYLRDALAPCEIWYGGDSSGICAELLDAAKEAELWSHFTGSHGRDYFRSWFEDDGSVRCGFCEIPATGYMSGPGRSGFACNSCGQHWVRYADGKIVKTDGEYRPTTTNRYHGHDLLIRGVELRQDMCGLARVDGQGDAWGQYEILLLPRAKGTQEWPQQVRAEQLRDLLIGGIEPRGWHGTPVRVAAVRCLGDTVQRGSRVLIQLENTDGSL